MEVVASLSQGRTAAAQCGLFTHKTVLVIFEPPCTFQINFSLPTVVFLFGYLILFEIYTVSKISPVTGLKWPRGIQEVKVPRFHDNCTGRW